MGRLTKYIVMGLVVAAAVGGALSAGFVIWHEPAAGTVFPAPAPISGAPAAAPSPSAAGPSCESARTQLEALYQATSDAFDRMNRAVARATVLGVAKSVLSQGETLAVSALGDLALSWANDDQAAGSRGESVANQSKVLLDSASQSLSQDPCTTG